MKRAMSKVATLLFNTGGPRDKRIDLGELAADLVSRQVAVIVATGGLHPAVVAKAATSTIPIVFTGGSDPVKYGLVDSLARPGGNATGAINFSPVVTAKRLELLRELLPTESTIAVLLNPTDPNNEAATEGGSRGSPRYRTSNSCRKCRQRARLRRGLCGNRATSSFRAICHCRPVVHQSACSTGGTRCTKCDPGQLCVS